MLILYLCGMDISIVDKHLFEEAVRLLNEAFPTDEENSLEWWVEMFANNHDTSKGVLGFGIGIKVDLDYSSKRIYYTGDTEKFLEELKSEINSYKEY